VRCYVLWRGAAVLEWSVCRTRIHSMRWPGLRSGYGVLERRNLLSGRSRVLWRDMLRWRGQHLHEWSLFANRTPNLCRTSLHAGASVFRGHMLSPGGARVRGCVLRFWHDLHQQLVRSARESALWNNYVSDADLLCGSLPAVVLSAWTSRMQRDLLRGRSRVQLAGFVRPWWCSCCGGRARV
jgi:hypothetical protein